MSFKQRSDRVRVLLRNILLVAMWEMDRDSETGGRKTDGEAK